MTKQAVILALASIFAFQVLGHPTQTVTDDVDNAMEKALKLLKEVRETINIDVESGTNSLNSIIESLHSNEEDANENIEMIAVVERNIKYLFVFINASLDGAEGVPQSLIQCIQAVKDNLIELETSNINMPTVCGNKTIKAVLQAAVQLLIDFSQINPQIDAQADILEKCRQDTIPVDCINNVVDNLNQMAIQVPGDIKDNVYNIKTESEKVKVAIEQCPDDIKNVGKQVETLQSRFYICLVPGKVQ